MRTLGDEPYEEHESRRDDWKAIPMQVGGRDFQIHGALLRIARLAADRYDSVDDPEATREMLLASGRRIDLFTFMQQLPDTSPKYAYPMEWDNVAALRVSTFDHWWTKQINTTARKAVRRAEKKGIVVREVPFDDALVRGISAVYNECPVRQGKPFWHYGKDLETVRRENGTFLERSIFIGAFLEENLVGFAKLVCDSDWRQAGLMQILSMIRHWDKAPAKALIAQAVRSSAERKIGYLVYGHFTYGKKPRDNLAYFKQLNGFLRIELPGTMSLSPGWAVPPSAWGCTIRSSTAFPNRCSLPCEELAAAGTGVGFRPARMNAV